jgi:hypothetical protein
LPPQPPRTFRVPYADEQIEAACTEKLEFVTMDAQSLREWVTDAIRYWEPRRLIYNAVLAGVVLFYFARGYPASKATLTVNLALFVFLLAVLANVAYCAAYVPDVFAQLSGFRDLWRKFRWAIFAIGLLFASVITRFWAIGFFDQNLH